MAHEETRTYLEQVGAQIRWRRARKLLCRELADHSANHDIEAYLEGQGGTRPRRYYRLTPVGRGRLQEKEQEWRQYVTAVERVLKGGECLA